MQFSFESARIFARPFELSDEADLLEYQSDENVVRYIPWPKRTRDQVHEALIKSISSTKFTENEDHLDFVWQLKESGKVIGQSNIGLVAKEHHHAEIGWVVNPLYSNQGYATEVTKALITFAFQKFDLHRISAYIDQRNSASIRVAERLGMRLEANYKEDELFKGEWVSGNLYAVLKSEWK
jgi:aminoglycoside 6'-N-acetyltransferase